MHDGYLEVRREAVEAPGTGAAHEELAFRERDVYYITESGRRHFYALLREALGTYTPGLNEIEACLFFLQYLEPGEAIVLLKERYELIARDRTVLAQQMQDLGIHDDAHNLVNDHKLALLEAELNWLARTIVHLEAQKDKHS
jgi:hypothetical protein